MTDDRWILIVDDDDTIREMLGLVLDMNGWRSVAAADGIEALERLHAERRPPALILLDLRMPRMNGAEFLVALRREPAWTAIPVVVLTGDAGAAELVTDHVADFLYKPVDAEALLASISAAAPTP